MLAAGLGVFSCSDKYDLDSDSNQPSDLSDIYHYLEGQGNYNNYLQLIRDLGEDAVLSKTGSKTLFVADDDAFTRFFASNSWHVSSYGELTTAQKKLLLYTSMVDNPFSTSMLATADGPVKGEVFRRPTSMSIYDSVLVVPASDPEGILPDNERFAQLKANHPSIVLFDEETQPAPMLHFTSKFMSANKVFTTDIDFLYSKWLGKDNRAEEDVYVNNAKVIDANVFCKNGFVQKVDEVVMPLDNMAETLRKCSRTQLYSSILERFAAPAYSKSLTDAYNGNKGTNYDSVFIKRYFSDRSVGSKLGEDTSFDLDKDGNPCDGSLKFDPGWNGFFPDITSKGSDPMMEEMAVMLVPTDEALTAWWNGEGGDDIRKFYAAADDDTKTGLKKTPVSVLDKMIRAGQYASFCQTIPSNFKNVLDDAQMELGLKESDIDSVILACNGAIYLTNKVFAPTSYSSVLSPSVIDTMSYSSISNSIHNMEYEAYLNSMVSTYTFLLPTNKAMASYIDPVSYGQEQPQLWTFNYDFSQALTKRITVDIYNCTIDENGIPTAVGEKVTTLKNPDWKNNDNAIKDRVEDLLDNMIITEGFQPGKQYYKTKANTFMRIVPDGNNYNVYGSWQQQYNSPIVVEADSVYQKKNGKTFIVGEMPMGASNSVAKTLALDPDNFSDFLWVLQNSGALSTTNSKDGWQAGDQTYGNLFNLKDGGSIGAEDVDSKSKKATYLLNNFHYTVYAPTNAAMQQAFAAGLPDAEALRLAEEYDQSVSDDPEAKADSAAKIQEVLLDFVKYHIQDNSIFVDAGFKSGDYESGKTELTKSTNIVEASSETTITVVDDTHILVNAPAGENTYETPSQSANANVITRNASGVITAAQYYTGKYSPGRPYKLKVNVSASGMTVTDVEGHVRHVSTDEKLHNLMAREYWYKGSTTINRPYQTTLDNSSFVTIQAIDGPLFFDSNNQFKYTRKQLTTEAKRRR